MKSHWSYLYTVLLMVVLHVVIGSGCNQQHAPPCPDEDKVERSQNIEMRTVDAITDPTAGGKLSGNAATGVRAMKEILLLDYSGSMYGGYSRNPPPNCPRCKATSEKRNAQPYHFELPEFRALVASWLDGVAPEGSDIKMQPLLFNKFLWLPTPTGAVQVTSAAQLTYPWQLSKMKMTDVAEALRVIPADPFRATSTAANETHMRPALEQAMSFLGGEGIIWFITDNISDQSGTGTSPDDAARNLAFYNLLRDDPRLQLVYAYPLFDGDDKCTFLCGSSLFVYGIHYAPTQRASFEEENRLSGNHMSTTEPSADGLLWNAALRDEGKKHAGVWSTGGDGSEMAGVPLRLKPMDVGIVEVDFKRDEKGLPVPIQCKQTSEFGQRIPCRATLVVKNRLRDQIISSMSINLQNDVLLPRSAGKQQRTPWASAVCSRYVSIREVAGADSVEQVNEDGSIQPNTQPNTQPNAQPNVGASSTRFLLSNLRPGQSRNVEVTIMLPAISISPASLGEQLDVAFTDKLFLEGSMRAKVENVRTQLIVPAEQRQSIYGAGNLPALFTSKSQSEVQVRFPVKVPVNNDGKLRAFFLLAALILAAVLIGFILFRWQPTFVAVVVDGVELERMRLLRFDSRAVEYRSKTLGRVSRGAGAASFTPSRDAQAKRSGSAWILTWPGGLEQRVEIKAAGAARSTTKKSNLDF